MIVEIINSKVLSNAAALTAKTTPTDRQRWWVTGVGGVVFKSADTSGDYQADDETDGYWHINSHDVALIDGRVVSSVTSGYTDITSSTISTDIFHSEGNFVANGEGAVNYEATAAPVVGDDCDDGYGVGSVWIDITGVNAYMCIDNSVGAAVWKILT